jgi:surface antigen
LRGTRSILPVLAVVAAGFLASGCSFSYQLGSLFGKDDDKPQTMASTSATAAAMTPAADADIGDTTGSISPTLVVDKTDLKGSFGESDVVAASQAASAILADGRKDASAPWQNPKTGARGTVTPIANAYTQEGFTCRGFLASYVNEEKEAWMQGEACRVHHGKWVVRSMKPWKRV